MTFKKFMAQAALTLLMASAAVSCDETSEIGSSIVDDAIDIVVDSSFTLKGSTVRNPAVMSRSLTQLIGNMDIPGYGVLHSNFANQYMPALKLPTEGTIDSLTVALRLQVPAGGFVGDSIVPMQLSVYRMTDLMSVPVYSNSPMPDFDHSTPLAKRTYNVADFRDSVDYSAGRLIDIQLPDALAHELYNAYVSNPDNFGTPGAFAQNVFRGLVVNSTYGSGRMTRITKNGLTLTYKRSWHDAESNADTTAVESGTFFAVTPEVINNNYITYSPAEDVVRRIAAGEHIMVAPAGYDIHIDFPGREVVSRFRAAAADYSVVNNLSLRIPVERLFTSGPVVPPPYVLLVLTSEREKFFANNSLTDNITSFYATYNTAGYYDFPDLRPYMQYLLEKESIEEADVQFTLCPINVETTESGSTYAPTTVVSGITPYISGPAMVKFNLDRAKIVLTFSKQSIKF
ncbi:MAG: DUF4270 domain-containing protein [Muribaculaceae bacterium]|nr:DUF4270 domain-containing protein [Muribaculaceae bacterium]